MTVRTDTKQTWFRSLSVALQQVLTSPRPGRGPATRAQSRIFSLYRCRSIGSYSVEAQRISSPSARLPRLATLRDRQPAPLVPDQIGAVAAPVRVGLAVPAGDRDCFLSAHPPSVSP